VRTHHLRHAVPRRAGVALAAAGAVLALASPSLADGTPWKPDPSPNPSSIGNTLSGVTALSRSDAWTVGWYTDDTDPDNGRNMLAARWNGTAWIQVPTPDLARSDEGLLAVSASSADEAWAVGFSQAAGTLVTRPLAVHWDGTAWTVVPTPATGGNASASHLYGVVSLGPTDAWAVGQLGLNLSGALIEHWDGRTWSFVPSPISTTPHGTMSLAGLSAVSPTDIWAVGSVIATSGAPNFRHVTLAEHYDGTSWSIVPSPNAGTASDELNSVVAVGANDVWAVGDTLDGATLVEHWNGTTWSIVPSPNALVQDKLTGVTAVSPSDVWAVGKAVDTSGTVPVTRTLTLHWDGVAWSVVNSPNGPSGGTTLFAASAVPGTGPVWAVGATGDSPVNTFIIHR
jgi:hypothetical protein